MREIKFRVWSESEQRYIYGLSRYLFGSDDNEKCTLYIPQDFKAIFEQYAGLKDKNGKEIYEGDILKFEDSIFEVGWFSKGARFGFCPIKNCNIGMGFSLNRTEVIGNIHENAELLKKEK